MTVDRPAVPALTSAETMAIVDGNTEFAFDLYAQLREGARNLFFSPYSISVALAMTCGGAKGKTEAQMARTLHFSLSQEHVHSAFSALETHLKAAGAASNVELQVANALWPQQDYAFLAQYLELARKAYGVSITPLDYAEPEDARGIINAWVAERTQGKITDLMGSGVLTTLTRLVLTNAVYFKGSWARPFDLDNTRDAPFWLTPDEAVEVPTMALKAAFRFAVLGGLRILELPYGHGDLSMLLILPNHRDGLANLEHALSADNLRDWTRNLRNTKVQVFLPRLKMTSQFRLERALTSMGMVDVFDRNRADFSGMDGRQWLYVSAVLHKAFVDVNEEGTEAAAATAVVMAAKAISLEAPTFRADHPFVFVIRDRLTGSILFLGRVVDPR